MATVPGHGQVGNGDRALMEVCRRAARCLVTMDLGFPHPLEYPPGRIRPRRVEAPEGERPAPARLTSIPGPAPSARP